MLSIGLLNNVNNSVNEKDGVMNDNLLWKGLC